MWQWLCDLDWFAAACWLGAVSLIAGGLIGTIFPAIPGLPLIAGGAWLIGWADHFESVGMLPLTVITVLAVIGVIVDTVAQTAGAQKAGASPQGIWGSLIGTVAGVFMGGLIGILVMPLVGAVLGEIYARRGMLHAGRVGLATWIGMVIGIAVKVALAFMMIGILVFAYFM